VGAPPNPRPGDPSTCWRADLSPDGADLADLAGPRAPPGLPHPAAELLDRAADLTAETAMLVHDDERRWRVFRGRVEALAAAPGGAPVSAGGTGP
jgi:hypothetical protein